jgi:hypothetical protein
MRKSQFARKNIDWDQLEKDYGVDEEPTNVLGLGNGDVALKLVSMDTLCVPYPYTHLACWFHRQECATTAVVLHSTLMACRTHRNQ